MKVMLSTCGLCQQRSMPPRPRSFLPRFYPRKMPQSSIIRTKLLSLQGPSASCVPGEKGCENSTTSKDVRTNRSMTMPNTTKGATTMVNTTKATTTMVNTTKATTTIVTTTPSLTICSVDKRSGENHCEVWCISYRNTSITTKRMSRTF